MANSKELEAVLLPQYQQSEAFMERFLKAAHDDDTPVERSPNNQKFKLVDDRELELDALEYFSKNCTRFQSEFEDELLAYIDQKEFDIFCDVIASEWVDGKRSRNEGRVKSLKRSIYDYLLSISEASPRVESFIQCEELLCDVEPLISAEAVEYILRVNDQMLIQCIEEWKSQHPNKDFISNDDIFLRRGLVLKDVSEIPDRYREWDFLNSYSMAFSVPEKFSQMVEGRIPVIINGDLALFNNRVLFFSPFIRGMNVGQLEFGIIPSLDSLPISFQGNYGGVLEYIIDPAPFNYSGKQADNPAR